MTTWFAFFVALFGICAFCGSMIYTIVTISKTDDKEKKLQESKSSLSC